MGKQVAAGYFDNNIALGWCLLYRNIESVRSYLENRITKNQKYPEWDKAYALDHSMIDIEKKCIKNIFISHHAR